MALTGITAIGLGLGAVVIPARVVLQQRPPPGLRARVIAGQLTLANAAAVIPLLVGGSLADWLGLGEVMMGLGVVALLAGLAGAGYLRRGGLNSLREPSSREPAGSAPSRSPADPADPADPGQGGPPDHDQ